MTIEEEWAQNVMSCFAFEVSLRIASMRRCSNHRIRRLRASSRPSQERAVGNRKMELLDSAPLELYREVEGRHAAAARVPLESPRDPTSGGAELHQIATANRTIEEKITIRALRAAETERA
jgi:hypothetical protein